MIEIVPLSAGYVPDLMPVAKAELGPDYLTEDSFLDVIDAENDFCKVALMDGRPVGFSICNVLYRDGIDPEMRLPDCPGRDRLMESAPVGYINAVSVSDAVKGHGAGYKMMDACLAEFAARGVTTACALAWKSVTGVTNIGHILERHGLESVMELKGYWNDLHPDEDICPVCGNPCRCSAVLYIGQI